MKKIEIEIPDGKRAGWVDGVLTLVNEKPKDVTERIKTFDDALEEIGGDHPFAVEYFDICGIAGQNKCTPDLKAYLKLRIICAALNEGWEPKFTEGERRYCPRFWFYTRDEINKKHEQDKKDIRLIPTDDYRTEYAGLACAYTVNVLWDTDAYIGSDLLLKNSRLAVYCGRQFADIWADYLLRRE